MFVLNEVSLCNPGRLGIHFVKQVAFNSRRTEFISIMNAAIEDKCYQRQLTLFFYMKIVVTDIVKMYNPDPSKIMSDSRDISKT